jgi:hypothetical protein
MYVSGKDSVQSLRSLNTVSHVNACQSLSVLLIQRIVALRNADSRLMICGVGGSSWPHRAIPRVQSF